MRLIYTTLVLYFTRMSFKFSFHAIFNYVLYFFSSTLVLSSSFFPFSSSTTEDLFFRRNFVHGRVSLGSGPPCNIIRIASPWAPTPNLLYILANWTFCFSFLALARLLASFMVIADALIRRSVAASHVKTCDTSSVSGSGSCSNAYAKFLTNSILLSYATMSEKHQIEMGELCNNKITKEAEHWVECATYGSSGIVGRIRSTDASE